MSCYKKGQIVEYNSPRSPKVWQRALFVEHDMVGFPKSDAILAIRLGPKGSKKAHKFRWPLEYIR